MALRTYKSQRLQVRAETEYRGSSVATFTSMSYGYPRGMGTGVVVTDNISTFRTWGVYRGPQRLSAPDFLHLAQAAERRDALVADIKRLRRKSKVWYGVAGAGVAGVVAGLVGMASANNVDTYRTYNQVSLAGTLVTIGGLFGASFPASKASRLYKYPGASMSSRMRRMTWLMVRMNSCDKGSRSRRTRPGCLTWVRQTSRRVASRRATQTQTCTTPRCAHVACPPG